jgi:hypothetical protein
VESGNALWCGAKRCAGGEKTRGGGEEVRRYEKACGVKICGGAKKRAVRAKDAFQ